MVPHFTLHLAFDGWFEGKRKIEYGDDTLSELLPHQEYVRRREAKIMQVIIGHSDSGIAHLQLAQLIGVNRKNLTSYTKRLMTKGLIKRGKGKHGKYYPATKAYRGTIITADLFGKAAAGLILANEDFPIDSPFFINIGTGKALQYVLFMFSNKLGAIITYLLIQAMNPANKIMGDTKNDEEKDLNVQRWLDDAMSPLLPALLPLFKGAISVHLESHYGDYINEDGSVNLDKVGEDFLSFGYDRPLYTLKEEFISEVMAAFSKSYPSITNGLEKIRSQVPRVIAQQKSHWEYMSDCLKQQKLCKHNYELPLDKSWSAKSNNRILHCRKCHKTKYDKSLFRTRTL
jgi:predicted transcriptional regulator